MENTDNKKQRLATAVNTPKQLSFYVIIYSMRLLLSLLRLTVYVVDVV